MPHKFCDLILDSVKNGEKKQQYLHLYFHCFDINWTNMSSSIN